MSAGLDSTMVAGTAAKLLAPGRQVFAHCLDPTPAARGTGDIGNWRYTDLPDARAMADLWPSLAVVPLRIAPGETMLEAVPCVRRRDWVAGLQSDQRRVDVRGIPQRRGTQA